VGPIITPGYLNRPEATAEAIDADGWLHTGDLATMDGEGYVRIVGRKKELIITAGGKNLSPNNIEESIKQRSPLIAQLCAVGDERPFVSALVVLDAEALPTWAEAQGLSFGSVAEAAQHPRVLSEIQQAIDAGNTELARVEQVRKWAIVPAEWTAESEECGEPRRVAAGLVSILVSVGLSTVPNLTIGCVSSSPQSGVTSVACGPFWP
jgi:long-chain acyl-CoA synthetase